MSTVAQPQMHLVVTHSDIGTMSMRGRHGIVSFGKCEVEPKLQPPSRWSLGAREDDYLSPDGVAAIVERIAATGVRRIYWRTFMGGYATYPSRTAAPFAGIPPGTLRNTSKDALHYVFLDKLDYRGWDSLKIAVEAAHRRGVEIHAWFTFREEDHTVGFLSPFARDHPQWCQVNRDGRRLYSNLSWAFSEAVEYKRRIVLEILDRGVDGLLLDYCRKNAFKHDPISDISACLPGGYEVPVVSAFLQKTGRDPVPIPDDDPEWLAWRAGVETEFLRQVRAWTKGKTLGAMVHEERNREFHRLDIETWTAESLVDELVPIFQDRPFNHIHQPGRVRPCKIYQPSDDLTPELNGFRPLASRGRVLPGVYCYNFAYELAGQAEPQREILRKRAREVAQSGLPAMVLFEANHFMLTGVLDSLPGLLE